MALNYQVMFTATAEQDYERYCDQSEQGDGKQGALVASIDKAVGETLAISPIRTHLALAGSLSFIFMLSLGPICIYYIAYAEHGTTYVVHIGDNQKGADLSPLYEALREGGEQAEAMLQELGIESSVLFDAEDERQGPWVN